jgi:beta-glucosidase/6-phospho-beta-glucosidase/beta-galactosidase
MGGFEAACPKNKKGNRVDLLALTRHDKYCRRDYKLLIPKGIFTVRESLQWSQIEKSPGIYDFSRYEKMMQVGKELHIQQIWGLNHFDFPEHLDPFSKEFVYSFAVYAKACIKLIRKYQTDTIYIIPINEISFFSFIGGSIGHWAPFAKNKGEKLKKQLVRAAIAAMDAIWSIDSRVVFVHTDPVVVRVPKNPNSIIQRLHARNFLKYYFKAWDMLSGISNPELGGHPKYLQILGGNYYIDNQEWIVNRSSSEKPKHRTISWEHPDRKPLDEILKIIYQRYKKPFLISETGSYGINRVKFWNRTLVEIDYALEKGIPVLGVCAYPVIDRPDWDNFKLTNSGLWDFKRGDHKLNRIPHKPTLSIIEKYITTTRHLVK